MIVVNARRERGWLSRFPAWSPGNIRVRFMSSRRLPLVLLASSPEVSAGGVDSPKRLELLGLTPREAEVLLWVAQG